MSWIKRIIGELFAARPTEVPLLPSGRPDEKRMAVIAKNRFDSETEGYCQRLFCLQQYTLIDMFERSLPRVIVLRAEVQAKLKADFGIEIADVPEAEAQIKRIGHLLCEKGGFARMVLVAHRVAFLGGSSRQLEFSWNGICGWRH